MLEEKGRVRGRGRGGVKKAPYGSKLKKGEKKLRNPNKVVKVPANRSLRRVPDKNGEMRLLNLPSPPGGIDLKKLPKFLVLWEHLTGKPTRDIARKWSLSISQVESLLATPSDIEIPIDGIRRLFNFLNLQMSALQHRIINTITDEELGRASLSQKMIALGILSDKQREMDKHLSGTMDTSSTVNVTIESRMDLDERIKTLQEKMGFIQEAEVVENGEVRINKGTLKEEEQESPQLPLFGHEPPEGEEWERGNEKKKGGRERSEREKRERRERRKGKLEDVFR